MKKNIKVVITGAESTGKSTLAIQLAEYFNTNYLPEYAREYIERLNRPYNYNDVEKIAIKQIELEQKFLKKANKILFVDTSLFITKNWFEIVYNQKPEWFEKKLVENIADFYLLCNNDLEWIPDNVRENGGEKRNFLFEKYKTDLEKYNANFEIVKSSGKVRFLNAVSIISNYLKHIEQ